MGKEVIYEDKLYILKPRIFDVSGRENQTNEMI